MARKRKARIDKICEKAMAKTAVDALVRLAANSTHLRLEPYTDYAERFYKAGAFRVWFDETEEDEGNRPVKATLDPPTGLNVTARGFPSSTD